MQQREQYQYPVPITACIGMFFDNLQNLPRVAKRIGIGRWTTADPYQQFANPYLGMGNNPGGVVDPDGGFDIPILADLGNDFLNAVGNSLIGAGVGYGIGRLIGGREG